MSNQHPSQENRRDRQRQGKRGTGKRGPGAAEREFEAFLREYEPAVGVACYDWQYLNPKLEIQKIYNAVGWDAEKKAYSKMVEHAKSLGEHFLENPSSRNIEYRTWQEALNFQNFCKEELHFNVRIVEPPRNQPASTFKIGYRVFPVYEYEE